MFFGAAHFPLVFCHSLTLITKFSRTITLYFLSVGLIATLPSNPGNIRKKCCRFSTRLYNCYLSHTALKPFQIRVPSTLAIIRFGCFTLQHLHLLGNNVKSEYRLDYTTVIYPKRRWNHFTFAFTLVLPSWIINYDLFWVVGVVLTRSHWVLCYWHRMINELEVGIGILPPASKSLLAPSFFC